MSHTSHELADDFPDHVEKIHDLRANNPHFAKLAEAYHEINRAIHRAETNVEPTDDFHEGEMRKKRMALKDEIWSLLSSA